MTTDTRPQASPTAAPGAAPTRDNPSVSLAGESGSQGSGEGTGAAAAAAADHRGTSGGQVDLSALSDQELGDLLDKDPRLKGLVGRRVKSASDKAAYATRQQLEQEWQRRDAATRAETERKALLEKDSFELGEEIKKRWQEDERLAPLRQQAEQEGFGKGYAAAYAEMRVKTLDRNPYWKTLSPQQQDEIIYRHDDFAGLWETVIDRTARMLLDDELPKRERTAVEKALAEERKRLAQVETAEQRAIARDEERTPAVGGSAPPPSGLTQEVFDRNRRNSAWVRQNLDAIEQAIDAGRIRR